MWQLRQTRSRQTGRPPSLVSLHCQHEESLHVCSKLYSYCDSTWHESYFAKCYIAGFLMALLLCLSARRLHCLLRPYIVCSIAQDEHVMKFRSYKLGYYYAIAQTACQCYVFYTRLNQIVSRCTTNSVA